MQKFYTPADAPTTLSGHLFYGLELDDKQEHFIDAIWDRTKTAVVCNAKAGTGKTTLAVGTASMLYHYGFYSGVIFIISPTQEQRQGFVPGDPDKKNEPYMGPLVDALLKIGEIPSKVIISADNVESQKNGDAYIEFISDTYIRGVNFENKVVIIDEAQNFYFDILKKALTRCHDNCKIIIIGHDKQCDIIKGPERSGFIPYLNAFMNCEDSRVEVCKLTKNYRGWFSTFCDNVEYTAIKK